MNIRHYLPSAQFAFLLAALVVSGALVGAAEYMASPHSYVAALGGSDAGPAAYDQNWQEAFASSTAFQEAASLQETASRLSQAAQTGNLTDSIGRSLLINAAAAQGQGVSGNELTQSQLVANALSQVKDASSAEPDAYSVADTTTVPDSAGALHTYGNALAAAAAKHPQATYAGTMTPVAVAVDTNDGTGLSKLSAVAQAYKELARDVIAVPVPSSLASSQVAIANNYARMASACGGLQAVLTDPARGLLALQEYSSLYNSTQTLYIKIAETFKSNGILFGGDELGSLWAKFVSG